MFYPDWLSSFDTIGFHLFHLLFSILWQSSILMCGIAFCLFAFKSTKASTCHLLWVMVILFIPFIPVLSWGIAKIDIPQTVISVFPRYSDPHTRIMQSQIKEQALLKMHLPDSDTSALLNRKEATHHISSSIESRSHALRSGRNIPSFHLFTLRYKWVLFFFLYCFVFLLFFIWDMIGRWYISMWVSQSTEVTDPHIKNIFGTAKQSIGLKKEIKLYESAYLPAPLTFGFFHPVVILPSDLCNNLSEKEISAVAIHELFHIKRHDVFIISLLYYVKAFFFYHPLVWIGTRKASHLAEIACDNEVIAHCKDTVFYAKLLTRLKKISYYGIHSTGQAAGFIARNSTFYKRIDSILSQKEYHFPQVSFSCGIFTVLIAMVSMYTALSFPLGYSSHATDTISIRGKVVYKGNPVPDAAIYVSEHFGQTSEKVARSKPDGSFTFKMDRSKLIASHRMSPALLALKEHYAVGWTLLNPQAEQEDFRIFLDTPETVEGTVVDTNGTPLKNVIVSVSGLFEPHYKKIIGGQNSILDSRDILPDHKVKTDSYGRFVLTNVPPEMDIGISFKKKGYAETRQNFIPAGMKGMVVTMNRGGGIQGKVVYGNSGKTAKHISVIIEKMDGVNSIEKHTPLQHDGTAYHTQAKTNITGTYKAGNLSPGTYAVFLKDQISGWTAVARAGIEVKSGQHTKGADLTLVRGGMVTGRIFDTNTQQPLAGHMIRFTDTSHPASHTNNFAHEHAAYTDKDGYYCFRTAPGDVTYSTTGTDGYEIQYFCTCVGDEETPVYQDIHLDHGITITGNVMLDDRIFRKPAGRVYVNIPHEKLLHGGYAGLNDYVATGPEGRFTINGIRECDEIELHVFNRFLNINETIVFDVRQDDMVHNDVTKWTFLPPIVISLGTVCTLHTSCFLTGLPAHN